MDLLKARRKFKNSLSVFRIVKFPLSALIYKPTNNSQGLLFIGLDKLRADSVNGKEVFIFKSNADEVLPPSFGLEDARNTVDLLQIGEHDYKYLTRSLDKESGKILFSINNDEQAKYLFANQLENNANRFERPVGFLEKFMPWIVLIIATGLAAGIILFTATGNVAGMKESIGALTNAVNQNSELLKNVGGTVGNLAP